MDNISTHHTDEQEQPVVSGRSAISFTLEHPSEVSVEIYDLEGRQCAFMPVRKMSAGEQEIEINVSSLGIAPGKYVYYLQMVDQEKTTRECRVMLMR